MKPVIFDHNPTYINDFENPITLNWTVYDDNLIEHKIYQDQTLIDEREYNFTVEAPQNTSITLTFHLDLGRYNFTLEVIDGDNQTTSSTIEILKGSELAEIPELPIQISQIMGTLLIIGLVQFMRNKKYNTVF